MLHGALRCSFQSFVVLCGVAGARAAFFFASLMFCCHKNLYHRFMHIFSSAFRRPRVFFCIRTRLCTLLSMASLISSRLLSPRASAYVLLPLPLNSSFFKSSIASFLLLCVRFHIFLVARAICSQSCSHLCSCPC